MLPPIELQKQYEYIVQETKERLRKLTESSEAINTLFNSLSQKAFSGEL